MAWRNFNPIDTENNSNEFNSQDRYLNIVMSILEKLNEALIEGDAVKMQRSLLSLFNITAFKLELEKLEFAELKNKINSLSSRLIAEAQNESLFKKNNLFYTQTIGEYEHELLKLMNTAGMVYPKKEYKPLAEIIEAEF